MRLARTGAVAEDEHKRGRIGGPIVAHASDSSGCNHHIYEYRFIDMTPAPSLLRLLGDETRLRLLRMLSLEALNVSELTAVLGLAQSGVSRHLGLLRDAGLVVEERRGAFTWYALSPDSSVAEAGAPRSGRGSGRSSSAATAATKADDARLEEVRRLRKESFAQHGGGDERRQLVPGRSWAAWSRALGLLLPPLDVADLGCGEGYLTIEAARWARRVDGRRSIGGRARRARATLAARRRVRNITWKRGELERLPLADASSTSRCCRRRCTTRRSPRRRSAEAVRMLRPGGRVLVLDLRRARRGVGAAKLGDRWLGFSADATATVCSRPRDSTTSSSASARGVQAIRSPCWSPRDGSLMGPQPPRCRSRVASDAIRGGPDDRSRHHAPAVERRALRRKGHDHPADARRSSLDPHRRPRRRDGHDDPAPHARRSATFAASRFAAHAHDLKGNNDVLVLTRPDIVGDIHREVPRGRR